MNRCVHQTTALVVVLLAVVMHFLALSLFDHPCPSPWATKDHPTPTKQQNQPPVIASQGGAESPQSGALVVHGSVCPANPLHAKGGVSNEEVQGGLNGVCQCNLCHNNIIWMPCMHMQGPVRAPDTVPPSPIRVMDGLPNMDEKEQNVYKAAIYKEAARQIKVIADAQVRPKVLCCG